MILAISLIGAAFSSPVIADSDSSVIADSDTEANNLLKELADTMIDLSTIKSIHVILPTTVAINGAISGGIQGLSKGYKNALKGTGAGFIGGGIVGKLAAIALIRKIAYKHVEK